MPICHTVSFNRYSYANNNPYRYTGPTGMISEDNPTVSTSDLNSDAGGLSAGNASSPSKPLKNPKQGVSNDDVVESDQEKVDRLDENVSQGFSDLAQPEVTAVVSADTLLVKRNGAMVGENKVIVEAAGSDNSVQELIFHERLHVDKANALGLDTPTRIRLYDLFNHGGHDPAINRISTEYYQYLNFPELGNPQPDINDFPWRKE